jgi:hypothetical protein
MLPGCSFGRAGGCASVALAIQRFLDDERIILHLDGCNAFNNISRFEVFNFVRSRGPKWYSMYPFLNLFYATVSVCILVNSFGEALWTQEITVGASQGCSSGPFIFHLGVFAAVRSLRGSPLVCLSVTDDMYVVFKSQNGDISTEALTAMASFLVELARIGVDVLSGDKTKILCARSMAPIATRIAKRFFAVCALEHYPTDVLGTLVVPDFGSHLQSNLRPAWSLLKPFEKVRSAFQAVAKLDTTLFIKFQLLRFIQCKFVYLLSSCSHRMLDEICNLLAAHLESSLSAVFGLEQGPFSYLIFSPIEEEGLGFYPVRDLAETFRNPALNAAVDLLDELNFPHGMSKVTSGNVRQSWKKIVSCMRTRNRNLPIDVSHHPRWLETWPSIPARRLDDVSFKIGLNILLHQLPSVDFICVTRAHGIFKYAEASPTARHDHWFSCTRCGSAACHYRHRLVLEAYCRTAHFHGSACQIEPKNMPVPGKLKGGPDFLHSGKHGMLVGDVRISKQRRLRGAFNVKLAQYDHFSKRMNGITFPFIMSAHGSIFADTLRILWQNCPSKQEAVDIIINTQFALFRALSASYSQLSVRLSDDPSNTSDEHDLDEELSDVEGAADDNEDENDG